MTRIIHAAVSITFYRGVVIPIMACGQEGSQLAHCRDLRKVTCKRCLKSISTKKVKPVLFYVPR